MKVDATGNLFATGPGGVLVFAPDGTHLGTLATGEATANCGWGDDGSTLYITADMYLGRVRLTTRGKGFASKQARSGEGTGSMHLGIDRLPDRGRIASWSARGGAGRGRAR